MAAASAEQRFPLAVNRERGLLYRELARANSAEPPASHVQLALCLRGRLEIEILAKAFTILVRRHSGFRLKSFPNPAIGDWERRLFLAELGRKGSFTSGPYWPSIADCPNVQVRLLDVSDRSPSEQAAEFRRACESGGARNFDGPPLLKAALLRVGPEEHRLLLTVDHLLSGGRSARVMGRELAGLYGSLASHSDVPTDGEAMSFSDFAVWPNHAMKGSYYALSRLNLGAATANSINAFARQSGVTIYVLFLVSFVLLLHHYTRKSPLAIWSHLANRLVPEAQNTVGLFVNTHLIGVDFTSDLSGRDLLREVRRVVLDAHCQHQQLPLPHLWRKLRCHPRFPDASILLGYRQLPEPIPRGFGRPRLPGDCRGSSA